MQESNGSKRWTLSLAICQCRSGWAGASACMRVTPKGRSVNIRVPIDLAFQCQFAPEEFPRMFHLIFFRLINLTSFWGIFRCLGMSSRE
ncbi:hypothetical protein BDV37DRAFT_45632 [Aspergillus pseudonomiae]|uniref:Uncharacterized protein n=1 Tax=Aspergillus pseudonomiae TaxID=1506151 RepID=A0A5N7CUJ3_9EURO|nr:uncharacterized protein BDV37DRAFT_45632 [Aspergillus pseudonomiae]KAE8397852.1 hypothetical protein BDV37DRAFT_45632 [Aspergillus pseudonomiae]